MTVTETTVDVFPIKFDIAEQSLKRRFGGVEEVRTFLDEEVSFWNVIRSRVLEGSQAVSPSGHASQLIENAGRRAAAEARQIAQSEDPNRMRAALEVIENHHAVLGAGKFGQLLRDSDLKPRQVLGLLIASAAASNNVNLTAHIHNERSIVDEAMWGAEGAVLFGTLGRRASPERVQNEKVLARGQEVVATMEADRDAFRSWETEHQASARAGLEAFQTSAEQKVREFSVLASSAITNANDRLAALVAETEQEIASFKKKVRTDVVNEVPTTFWNGKATGHLVTAAGAGVVFILAVGVAIWWVDSHAITLVVDATRRIAEAAPNSTIAGFAPFLLISIPALAAAWVLRHISRIIVQNLSLHADAKLRGTITSTFRALAEDRGMNEAELALTLQALFRPIDGKDHAEVAPPSLADILKLGEK